jgi:general stress protein 26
MSEVQRMNEKELKEFTDILRSFDTAMLVTQRDRELRSRPMVIADTTNDGRVWFITSIDSAKLDELTENPNVNVAMQAGARYLSISGAVRATRDPQKVDELWNVSHSVWFSHGRNDPTLVLLEVVPTYVEYWDRSGVEAIKFMFASARSTLTGETLDDDEGVHGKVDFPKTTDAAEESARRDQ